MAITDAKAGGRDSHGNWRPNELVEMAPLLDWPPRPKALFQYFFGFPGYIWPYNIVYVAIAVVTWFYLTPPLPEMKSFAFGWVAFIYARNLAMLVAINSAWHLWFYVWKVQGRNFKYFASGPAKNNRTFLFGDQMRDNLFWNLASGCTIWSAYDVLTMWAYANDWLPTVNWETHPVYCTLLLFAIPAFREMHFTALHLLLHWPPLYRIAHQVHHRNVNVNPWSGLSMHPIEHLIYFTGVLVHWVIPSHPVHAIFHMQHAAFAPAQGHSGFESLVLGNYALKTGTYMHSFHHRHIECNYSFDGTTPTDRWFSTFFDGSEVSMQTMTRRLAVRRAARHKHAA